MKNLKKLREQNNLSQAALAEALHISPQTVYAYEVGKTVPSVPILQVIADFFGTSTDYLLGRSTFQYPATDLAKHLTANAAEEELLALYRSLPGPAQARAAAILRELAG